jgi:DNA-directed RNA polymerase specialized sigma24 family protein
MCPQRWLEDWPRVWAACFRRIRNWQVPPRWSSRDWWEEARAQAAIAAWKAYQDYDPAQGLLPLEAFLHLRVLASVRTRYRQEWGYGLHHGSTTPATGLIASVDPSALVGDADLIGQLLESLKEGDRWLLRQLFWVGMPEDAVAQALGISRQAVNKRKMIILKSLRKMVRNTS